MLRLLATLSPGAVLVAGGLMGGVPLATAGYYAGKLVGHRQGFSSGTAAMASAVEKRNANAAQAARNARISLDACYEAGGSWDQTTGKCFP